MTTPRASLQVQATIKQLLKKGGHRQKHLAKALGVSVPTVKRMLNGGELDLGRLEKVAGFLGMSAFDLLDLARERKAAVHSFTEAQEAFLARSLLNLLVFRAFLRGHSPAWIRHRYGLSKAQLEKVLLGLDKAGLVELWAEERVKLKARWPFRWLDGGPLSRAYFGPLVEKIFSATRARGSREGNVFRPFEMALRPETAEELRRELLAVLEKYRSVSRLELLSREPMGLVDITGLLALGELNAWEELRGADGG